MNQEKYEEMEKRFNENPRLFIMTEALKIFHQASNDMVAIEALEILEKGTTM